MRRILVIAAAAAVASIGWNGTAVAVASTACDGLGGAVDATGTCRVQATQPDYTLAISFPDDYPDGQAVADYLNQQREGFINVAEMPGSRGLPYEMDATGTGYSSTAPAEGGAEPVPATSSVVFELFQDVGGAHPVTWFKAFNYDMRNKAPLTFESLFKPGTKPLEVILPVVQRELNRQTGTSTVIGDGVGLDPSKYQNFAVTDVDLIFFFGQGELLPESAGANVVHVPRSTVATLLA